jgi:ABC-type uncharacterized transport system substrate-binding protein
MEGITSRIRDVCEVVAARRNLYDEHVGAFKVYPSASMRDTLRREKNSIVEAWNRFKPINADIAKIVAKGAIIADRYEYKYPGYTDAEVAKEIAAVESEFAKLIDTYPVD